MNAPAGFELVNGQAVNVDPLAAMANPAALPQAIHMTLAAYAATGFAVAGIPPLLLLQDPPHAPHPRAPPLPPLVGGAPPGVPPPSREPSAGPLSRPPPPAVP